MTEVTTSEVHDTIADNNDEDDATRVQMVPVNEEDDVW